MNLKHAEGRFRIILQQKPKKERPNGGQGKRKSRLRGLGESEREGGLACGAGDFPGKKQTHLFKTLGKDRRENL